MDARDVRDPRAFNGASWIGADRDFAHERPSLSPGADAPLQFAQPLRADLTQRQREVVLRNHRCEADGRVKRERAVILDVNFQADTTRAVRT